MKVLYVFMAGVMPLHWMTAKSEGALTLPAWTPRLTLQEQMKLQQLAAEQQQLTFRPVVNRTGTARINLRNPETYLQTLKARNEARAQQAQDEAQRRLVSAFWSRLELVSKCNTVRARRNRCKLAMVMSWRQA